jgi:hypothetical protein
VQDAPTGEVPKAGLSVRREETLEKHLTPKPAARDGITPFWGDERHDSRSPGHLPRRFGSSVGVQRRYSS